MSFSHNYHPINSKNIPSQKYNPYLISNKENISNNIYSTYFSSESNISNISKQKREINSYNDIKKSLNLDIPKYNNNTIDPKKDFSTNLHHYSSFSSRTSNANSTNIIGADNTNKKTLILDLDETLVHSAFTPFTRKSDLMLTINFDGEDRLLYVLKRPYVDEFLKELADLYEIIIFTASISEYANPLLDLLDKHKCIKYRLFREHCTFDNGIYIKDLKIFDRKINNMIIIDNNPLSYDNNIANGIPILSWYEDLNDKELLKLLPILKYMSNKEVYDVRNIINKIVDRNTNEIDYNAINKVIGTNKVEQNNTTNNNKNVLISKNEYRKINKSEEPKFKMINSVNKNNEEEKYNYNLGQNKVVSLKNNYLNKYNNTNQNNNILNSKFNINNIYNYTFDQNPNINIDKKDPYGTRISIFSPEEYNSLYNRKSYHFPFNRNMYTINSVEERKDNDNITKTINPQNQNNSYLFDKYNSNTYSNKRHIEKTLSYKENGNRKKINKNILEMGNPVKVSRTHSLVELTRKALHLIDKKSENKNINEYDSVSKALNQKKYFKDNKKVMSNNYINGKKNINNYKSDRTLYNNHNPKKYFRNYLQESKNIAIDNNNMFNNIINQGVSLKQMNSNNKEGYNIQFNNFFTNTERERLLKRINNDKINNFLGINYSNKENNSGNNYYITNYSQMNKESYLNTMRKSIEQNKENFNKRVFYNSNMNSYKNKNNIKQYNNKRYDLLNIPKKNEIKNIIINHKSVSYINNKGNNLVNLKKSNTKANEIYNINSLMRSSSFVKPNNSALDKILENFSLVDNSNKENEINNNDKYVKNLNYRYDVNLFDI